MLSSHDHVPLSYSKSFLIEDEATDQSNNSNSIPLTLPPKLLSARIGAEVNVLASKPFFCYELIKAEKSLVSVEADSILYLLGHCRVICLKGKFSVDGYQVSAGNEIAFHKSTWNPASVVIMTEDSGKISKSGKKSSKDVDKLLKQHEIDEKINFQWSKCCLLIEKLSDEWLSTTEEEFSPSPPHSISDLKTHHGFQCCYELAGGNFLFGSNTIFSKRKLEISTIPSTWITTMGQIMKSYNQETGSSINSVICGSKGVGKSSLVRYFINNFLNVTSCLKKSPLCYIDCDLGQPEFTISGMLSLHIIDSPILSSFHFNLRKPEYSIFLGDITSRNEPERFCSCLKELLSFYQKYRNDFIQNRLNMIKKEREATSVSKGAFGGLLEEKKENEQDCLNILPLLVNTDGFVRYMGAEVLQSVLEIVQPNNVLYIRSVKDTTILPFDFLTQHTHCVLSTLESPNDTPSPLSSSSAAAVRPQPVELRNLRILSYFLRNSPIPSNSVLFKNASLIGSTSLMIATEVLNLPSLIIPFDLIIFNCLDSSIKPSNLFSVINMQLVSVSVSSPSQHKVKSFHLRIPSSITVFKISCLEEADFLPSEGLGFIRAIDLQRQCVFLTVPKELRTAFNDSFTEMQKIILTIGGNIYLPSYMQYSEGFPTFPYFASEFSGEGSSQLKPRTNLKRKGQNINKS
jgi:hypothetical protein